MATWVERSLWVAWVLLAGSFAAPPMNPKMNDNIPTNIQTNDIEPLSKSDLKTEDLILFSLTKVDEELSRFLDWDEILYESGEDQDPFSRKLFNTQYQYYQEYLNTTRNQTLAEGGENNINGTEIKVAPNSPKENKNRDRLIEKNEEPIETEANDAREEIDQTDPPGRERRMAMKSRERPRPRPKPCRPKGPKSREREKEGGGPRRSRERGGPRKSRERGGPRRSKERGGPGRRRGSKERHRNRSRERCEEETTTSSSTTSSSSTTTSSTITTTTTPTTTSSTSTTTTIPSTTTTNTSSTTTTNTPSSDSEPTSSTATPGTTTTSSTTTTTTTPKSDEPVL